MDERERRWKLENWSSCDIENPPSCTGSGGQGMRQGELLNSIVHRRCVTYLHRLRAILSDSDLLKPCFVRMP